MSVTRAGGPAPQLSSQQKKATFGAYARLGSLRDFEFNDHTQLADDLLRLNHALEKHLEFNWLELMVISTRLLEPLAKRYNKPNRTAREHELMQVTLEHFERFGFDGNKLEKLRDMNLRYFETLFVDSPRAVQALNKRTETDFTI